MLTILKVSAPKLCRFLYITQCVAVIDEIEAKTDSDGEDVITTVSDREKIEGILKENASDFDTLSGTLSASDILDDGESQSTHSGSIIDVESEGESEEDVESKNKRVKSN